MLGLRYFANAAVIAMEHAGIEGFRERSILNSRGTDTLIQLAYSTYQDVSLTLK